MIANNVIFLFFIFHFNYKSIHCQIRNNHYTKKLPSDDEDSKLIQSSGFGPVELPKIYPSLNPFSKSKYTADLLVDIAIKEEFRHYMLPNAVEKSNLILFHNEIIKNLKEELKSLKFDLEFNIISLRPGPLISKKSNYNSKVSPNPSVFARINITQYNSSIINPIIIFHINQCGRIGTLGNLTISDQIIFPLYACLSDQVYCLPDCRSGIYCDGIHDCPNTDLDESPSCSKCIYKNLKLSVNDQILNEGENLILRCEFKESCNHYQDKLRWKFPNHLKTYENSFDGQTLINSLPRNEIRSGSFKCILDGESAVQNITVYKKPQVLITNMNPDSDMVLITELEGTDVDLWCNSTSGHAQWILDDPYVGTVIQPSRIQSRISIKRLSGTITIKCQVRWGFDERGHILKSVKLNVVCDSKRQFSCVKSSGKICIPIEQKCDSITQCEDGSDEMECNYCTENAINVDVGRTVFKDAGDTLIMLCSSDQNACKPLQWTRYNSPLTNNGNLLLYKQSVFILNISSHNAGIYRCSGPQNKGYFDVSVIVYEHPKLHLNPALSMINLTYGQSIDIECSIQDLTNPHNQNLRPVWNLDKNKIAQESIKTKLGSSQMSILSLSRVTKDVEGEYQCEVIWGLAANKKSSISIKINVNSLVCNNGEKMCIDKMMCIPNAMWCDGLKQCHDGSDEDLCNKCQNGFVFVQPSNRILLSKESMEVTCYHHKDCYPVEWRVLQNKVPIESISGITPIDNKLLFNNIGPEATNVYECFSGEKSSQINVTVINEIVITFINNPGYVFSDYGSDIEVDCQTNYGEPRWQMRDSKSVEDIIGAKQSLIQPNIARLTIKSASYDARGYYNCSIRLPGSNKVAARKLMYIHVYDLECADSYLKCDQNTKCIPKHKLCDNIQDCRDNEDEKNCPKCRYELEVKPKSLVLSTTGWGTLQCVVPHKDCLPIEWQAKGGQKLDNKGFYQYNDSLFLFNSPPRNNEEIICTNGQKSSSAFLTVKSLDLTIIPNMPENSVLFIKKGDSKTIKCKSNLGSPQWTFSNYNILPILGIQFINGQSSNAIIKMDNIQENATGNYICSVTFAKETKKKTISIKVI